MTAAAAAAIVVLLPQTQCQRCGYRDCAAYAAAIADNLVPINQCPPGGEQAITWLSALTGQPALPLNPVNGSAWARSVARIDEDWCIGCAKCLNICPTDAIVGSHKLMHTVIEAYCTGCELCLRVCPVDCIVQDNHSADRAGWEAWSRAQADQARQRYHAHRLRQQHQADSVCE